MNDRDDGVNQLLQKAACRPLQKNFRALTNGVRDMSCLDYLFSEDVIDIDMMEQVEDKEASNGCKEAVRLLLTMLIKLAQREQSLRVASEFHRSLEEAGGMAQLAELVGRSLREAEAEMARLQGSDGSGAQTLRETPIGTSSAPSQQQEQQQQDNDWEGEEKVGEGQERCKDDNFDEEESKKELNDNDDVDSAKLASIQSNGSPAVLNERCSDREDDLEQKRVVNSLDVSSSSLSGDDRQLNGAWPINGDALAKQGGKTHEHLEDVVRAKFELPEEDTDGGAEIPFKEPLDVDFEEVVSNSLSGTMSSQMNGFHAQEETHAAVDRRLSGQQPSDNVHTSCLMNGDLERCSLTVFQPETPVRKWRFVMLGGEKFKLDEMRQPSKEEKERLVKEGAPRWKKVTRELPSATGGSAYEYVDEQHFATSFENDRERCRAVLEDWLAKTSVYQLGRLYDAYKAAGLGRVAESLLTRCTE